MAGSGTVIRQAIELGHSAVGFDLDPLAVLMTQVWTTPLDSGLYDATCKELAGVRDSRAAAHAHLPWIDDDPETAAFIEFWFGEEQRTELRRIAYALNYLEENTTSVKKRASIATAKLALSRIVVTKDRGASLARDVSHSRPHRVTERSDYQVYPAYVRSLGELKKRLLEEPPRRGAKASLGDARHLTKVSGDSVDAIVTSPPYLNAIDYMRGHRLSLVWIGHSLAGLRAIRSTSIGSERAPLSPLSPDAQKVRESMGSLDGLPSNFSKMIDRYVVDLVQTLAEATRVLRANGRAVLVVGDSCLRGVFIRNSNAVEKAAELAGLKKTSRIERDLPSSSRYLPMTSEQLAKRMRTETVLSFSAPA
jgi:DNA modification methylase